MSSVPQDPSEEPCSSCGVTLDTTGESLFSMVRCPRCRSEVRVRKRVGPYELLENAGQGGSGRVFRARCTTQDGTVSEVALKVLEKSSPDYEEHLMLLRNEAVSARLVDHPSVVKVLSLEEDEHGARLMMEFMEGGSLHERIASAHSVARPLGEAGVLRICVEMLDALAAAEARGIVHRDLKPANILFAGDGRAKLGDFGLARSTATKPVSQSHLLATPDYVAPEMLEGFPGDVRSDLYGLGCCLYHVLASLPPYQTEGLSIPELLALKSRPVSLSGVSASPRTRQLIARMTDPDPRKRFVSHEQARSETLSSLHAAERQGKGLGALMRNLFNR